MLQEDFFKLNEIQKKAILANDAKELDKFSGAEKLVCASKKPWFNPNNRCPIDISNDYDSTPKFEKDYQDKLDAARREIIKKHACDKDGETGLPDELSENGFSKELSDDEQELLDKLSKDCERLQRERKIQKPEPKIEDEQKPEPKIEDEKKELTRT